MQSVDIGDFDLNQLRERLRKMTDVELREFGRAARESCSPKANLGQPTRDEWVVELGGAEAEWKRRKSPPIRRLGESMKRTDSPPRSRHVRAKSTSVAEDGMGKLFPGEGE
jgi:hypothetical protein